MDSFFTQNSSEMLLHLFSSCLSDTSSLQHQRINLRAPIHRLGPNLDWANRGIFFQEFGECKVGDTVRVLIFLANAIELSITAKEGTATFTFE